MTRHILVLTLAMGLCACGGGASDGHSPDGDERQSEGPKTGYEQALERAKDVEKQASEAAEERRKQIEKLQESEGGGN